MRSSSWLAISDASAAGAERLPIYVGVDASAKRDTTALCAVTFDKKSTCVRLVAHRVFTPTPGDPIDFEETVERTLLEWRQRYVLRQALFDPFQMAAARSAWPKLSAARRISADAPEPDGGHAATCST